MVVRRSLTRCDAACRLQVREAGRAPWPAAGHPGGADRCARCHARGAQGDRLARAAHRAGQPPEGAQAGRQRAVRLHRRAYPNPTFTYPTMLDSRQKALKLAANALYGFTGARPWPPRRRRARAACLRGTQQSCMPLRRRGRPHALAWRTGRPRMLAASDASQQGSEPSACTRARACAPAAALQELVQGCARLAACAWRRSAPCPEACGMQLGAASRAASTSMGLEERRACV